MSYYLSIFRECFFIPKPTLTEKNLPDQKGRVFIVTGGYAGVGKELCKILYQHNGTIYVAGRSDSKAKSAIDEISKLHPNSQGKLEFLHLDLADLTTIKKSAETFLAKEQRLDVLTNNAGVMTPPIGSITTQNYELQLGTNVLGPWLFTHFLTPILQKTAASSPPGSVRVTWAASLATAFAPSHGVTWDPKTSAPKTFGDKRTDYAQSKSCNVLLAREFANRFAKTGVISNAWNPGNLKSELQRHLAGVETLVTGLICYEPVFGAYTELFAGWGEAAGREENAGKYVVPWGRVGALRQDLLVSGETGRLWEWCEKESRAYM
ncbi:hypothetical protein B0A48_15908 [Cryoendolithus antarcticus]|uniref:NAD(P)-binding protein n=1 Tax=Cryoendolithus antarcticus TaxID=1507870 RepID=A0A1V8SG12_9PEZI|nr:hypothetical protein B0A48_15908 [Cryoendolithus antarcticus]